MEFKEITVYHQFFKMLPLDWQESIEPFWDVYEETTRCFMLFDLDKTAVAGGMVFSECPPDMLYAKEEATHWFQNGYLYVGFLYVLEEKRGQHLGSKWLSQLITKYPNQKYWLTIEDENLHSFYTKNGFKKVKTLWQGEQPEMLYVFEGR